MSYPILRCLADGTSTVAAAATPERLIDEPAAGTAKVKGTRIWIGAPRATDGTAGNTREFYYGNADSQAASVAATDFEGRWLPTGDPYALYIKVKVNGEKVAYQIWG